MLVATAVVRDGEVAFAEGHEGPMKAASLLKPLLAHVALAVLDDLDEPVHDDITARHVLSHTTGLPNWRPEGEPLTALHPPGTTWGYSGEGFVLLQSHLERRTGRPIDVLLDDLLLRPLGLTSTFLEPPEPGFHGSRPLRSSAVDLARFLAHALGCDDDRFVVQHRLDDEIAWGAGWGLELSPALHAFQWGLDVDAGNVLMGRPESRDGVVVLTDSGAHGRSTYRPIVERHLPGDHPAFRWLG